MKSNNNEEQSRSDKKLKPKKHAKLTKTKGKDEKYLKSQFQSLKNGKGWSDEEEE